MRALPHFLRLLYISKIYIGIFSNKPLPTPVKNHHSDAEMVYVSTTKTTDIENVLCSSHLIAEVKWEEDNWRQ